MHKTRLFLAAATAVLTACNSEPEVLNERYDPQAEALKNAGPVAPWALLGRVEPARWLV